MLRSLTPLMKTWARSPRGGLVLIPFFVAILLSAQPAPQRLATPADGGWPRTLVAGGMTFTVYQPQLDEWDGFLLKARAAVAAEAPDKDQQAFGVIWLSARTDVDKDERMVTLDQVAIDKALFPSQADGGAAYFDLLVVGLPKKTRLISLDRLEAQLAIARAEKATDALPLKNDPPIILFSNAPALLVVIDGEPVYRPVDGTGLERVVNTRVLLLRDGSGAHYLHLFDGWVEAPGYAGPWKQATRKPADLEKARDAVKEAGPVDLLEGKPDPGSKDPGPSLAKGPVPTIYVATAATELMVTDGEWTYAPIEGTQLLYVSNTTGHIFKCLSDRKTYVLISGRWFRAISTEGPWEHVPSGKLPPDFAQIPDESPKENVKASIAGTAQAQEARISNAIPETASVKRSSTKMTPPVFDGEPVLKPIDGTTLQYVVNSATPIVMVDSATYYAVENGVWFVTTSLKGHWVVASSVAPVIYSIPPSSPLHFLTYVRVYSSTPDVVYVGYTPGYYGTCVDLDGVVVYGTGYHYSPWIGPSWWYGWPYTYGWGTSIAYTPWTGWTFGFGFGWYWGPATIGWAWGWGCHPWWGPYSWGPMWSGGAVVGPRGGVAVWGPGGWAATTGNVYRRWETTSVVSRSTAGIEGWSGTARYSKVGMSYNSRTGVLSAGQHAEINNVYTGNFAPGSGGVSTSGKAGPAAAGKAGTIGQEDSVFATHDGKLYRRDPSGWQSYDTEGWRKTALDNTRARYLDGESGARAGGDERLRNLDSSRQLYQFGGITVRRRD